MTDEQSLCGRPIHQLLSDLRHLWLKSDSSSNLILRADYPHCVRMGSGFGPGHIYWPIWQVATAMTSEQRRHRTCVVFNLSAPLGKWNRLAVSGTAHRCLASDVTDSRHRAGAVQTKMLPVKMRYGTTSWLCFQNGLAKIGFHVLNIPLDCNNGHGYCWTKLDCKIYFTMEPWTLKMSANGWENAQGF